MYFTYTHIPLVILSLFNPKGNNDKRNCQKVKNWKKTNSDTKTPPPPFFLEICSKVMFFVFLITNKYLTTAQVVHSAMIRTCISAFLFWVHLWTDLKHHVFLTLRWAGGLDCVKLKSPLLLKNISRIPEMMINRCPSPFSLLSEGSRSLSESTTMTKYEGGNSRSRDVKSLLKAKRTWTPSPGLDSRLRPVMDLSLEQLWPNCLWIQYQL